MSPSFCDSLLSALHSLKRLLYNRSGPEDSTKQTDLLFYRAEDVAAHPDLGFTTADLIFMALLSGGDYSVSVHSNMLECEDAVLLNMCLMWPRLVFKVAEL